MEYSIFKIDLDSLNTQIAIESVFKAKNDDDVLDKHQNIFQRIIAKFQSGKRSEAIDDLQSETDDIAEEIKKCDNKNSKRMIKLTVMYISATIVIATILYYNLKTSLNAIEEKIAAASFNNNLAQDIISDLLDDKKKQNAEIEELKRKIHELLKYIKGKCTIIRKLKDQLNAGVALDSRAMLSIIGDISTAIIKFK